MSENGYSLELVSYVGIETHLHRGLECILLLRGNLEMETDAETFVMREDDFAAINSGRLHTIKGGPDNLTITLFIDDKRLHQECGDLADIPLSCNGAVLDMQGDGTYFEIKRVLVKMLNIKLKKTPCYGLSLNMHLLRLLYLLYTSYSKPLQSTVDSGGTSASKLDSEAVLEYIQQNYRHPLTLRQISAHFFLSPTYFSRYFKKLAGVGFFQYVQQVRLERSIPQLLHSGDSILQVAMDNGFANAKAYTDSFLKQFGKTPGAYRKLHLMQSNGKNSPAGILVLTEDDTRGTADHTILRYIKRYELGNVHSDVPVDENHTVSILATPTRHLKPMENLLLIDTPAMALRKNFEFSDECREGIGARFAYFQLLDHHMPPEEFGVYTVYQIAEGIDAVRRHGLAPFLRLDFFCAKPFAGTDEEIQAYLEQRMFPLLEGISKRYHRAETQNWRFEIVCDCFVSRQAALFYRHVYQILRRMFAGAQVGVFATPDENGAIGEAFGELLRNAAENGMPPDFVTFHAFQNRVRAQSPLDTQFYTCCADFHADTAASVVLACRRQGLDVPLYMPAWNTLSGSAQAEGSVYTRAALIMETLMELYNTVQGVGYRYFPRNTCPFSGERIGTPLDLYIWNNAKRPVFYVANIIDRMSGALLYQTSHMAVVRNNVDELVVAVWNPQYLNPANCSDELLTQSLNRQIRVELRGLENRVYQVKQFIMDADSSGKRSRLQRSGFPSWDDLDTFEYRDSTGAGDFYYYTKEPDDGMLALQTSLQYNSIAWYILK